MKAPGKRATGPQIHAWYRWLALYGPNPVAAICLLAPYHWTHADPCLDRMRQDPWGCPITPEGCTQVRCSCRFAPMGEARL